MPALVDALRPFRPLFVEDPIQIDTIDVQTGLVSLGVPLGLGERWQSLWEVREALAAHGPFVVRTDVNMSGGITAGRKMAAVAEAHHAQVSWHNYLGPVSDAATLSVDAAIPNVLTHEHCPEMQALFGESYTTAWTVDDGHMVVRRRRGSVCRSTSTGSRSTSRSSAGNSTTRCRAAPTARWHTRSDITTDTTPRRYT